MKKVKISNNVIRRMPRYLRKLDELRAKGLNRVSSAELSRELGLTPSQIRQDFSCFGEFGQQGYGYNVDSLRDSIALVLGADRAYKAILVGIGNIGRALMDNFCFAEWGIELVAAFDVDVSAIGTSRNGVPVYSAEELYDYTVKKQVDIAVLAVPGAVARDVARNLTELGIDAIWNFTNVDIKEPYSDLIVENMHFSDSLMALSYYITERNELMARREAVGNE